MIGFLLALAVGVAIGWTFPQPEWVKPFWLSAKTKVRDFLSGR